MERTNKRQIVTWIMVAVLVTALGVIASVGLAQPTQAAQADTAVAQVGDTTYTTLYDACSAVASGGTVKLLCDHTESVYILSKELTLDLNGHILTLDAGTVVFNGELTLDNSVPATGGIKGEPGTSGVSTIIFRHCRTTMSYDWFNSVLDTDRYKIADGYLMEALVGDANGFTTIVRPEHEESGQGQGGEEETVTFGKVTDVSQITAENIDECTFADAKEWVLDHWDALHEGVDQDMYEFFAYTVGEELRYISFEVSDDKGEWDSFWTEDDSFVIDELKEAFSNDGYIVYLCGFAGGSGGSGSGDPIAQVGEVTYNSLLEAYNAVEVGGTILLLQDLSPSNVPEPVVFTKNITIDLNGHILGNYTGLIIINREGTTITLDNSRPERGGELSGIGATEESGLGTLILHSCRVPAPAEIFGTNEKLQLAEGFEAVNINEDGSPDENGFICIIRLVVRQAVTGDTFTPGDGDHLTAEMFDNFQARDVGDAKNWYPYTDEDCWLIYDFTEEGAKVIRFQNRAFAQEFTEEATPSAFVTFLQSNPNYYYTCITPSQGESGQGQSGDPTPAAHEHNDVTFEAWEITTSLPDSEGSYYLTADVTISSTWTVPSGTTNLCLNGHGIKKTGSNDSAVYVPSSAILNIYDCKDTEHKFTVDGNSIATIDDSLTSGYQTFIGGYITGGRGKASTGNRNGGGIFIDGECNLYGGNVIGNSVTVSDNCGAGVFCNDNSLFRMYGGSISYNYAQNAGCGVFAWHNSEAQIWGGEISHNKTSHASGSAISFYNPNGYTVSLKLYGGYIHDNLTGSTGGAVSLSATGLTVGLKGNLIVCDNATASTNGNATLNVYVSNTPINIEGALTNTVKIPIRLSSGTGVFTSGWSTYMNGVDPADYFYSENDAYGVYLLDGEAAILAEAPAPVGHIHDDVTFEAWESTTSLPSEAGNWYLTADVTISSSWNVPSGTTNLCLNGHSITKSGSGSVIIVNSGATLHLTDCDDTTIHYYTSNTSGVASLSNASTEYSFVGGYITGGVATDSRGGGLRILGTGNVVFSGGTLFANRSGWGGGIFTMDNATLTIEGTAAIIGNYSSGNWTSGGGMFMQDNSKVTMTGGSFRHNSAQYQAGGVRDSIVGDNCYFTMTGGEITGNYSATDTGNGFCFDQATTFKIGGSAKITGNQGTNDLYVTNGRTLTVIEPFTDEAEIGVIMEAGTGTFTSGWSTYMGNADPADYFVSENDAYGVYLLDGEAAILAEAPVLPHAHNDITFEAWESTTSLPDSEGSYYLTADVTISSSWNVPSGTTNLCLNGFGITMTGYDQSVIKVGSGATLNVYDCGETVHYFDVHSNGYAININETEGNGRESFVGGYVTGGQGTDLGGDRVLGGGFFVTGGTLHMYGGTVIGNYMTREFVKGAGVWVGYGGTFTMEDGVCIKYNWSDNVGGGVGVGAITDLNSSSGTFIMNGGEISHNRAAAGGGIMLRAGTVDLRGGTITNNSARDSGGGIDYEYQSVSTLTISGNPVVNGNTVNDHPHVNNVVLRGGTKPMIQISGALTSGANIHVMLGNGFPPTSTDGTFTSGWSTYMGSADPADYFYSENDAYGVYLLDGEAAILAEDPNASAITLGTGLLYVGGVDIVAAENYTVNGNGGGTAVLSQGADGNPVLTLTNFVYTGAGYGGKYGYEGGAIDFRTDYNETGFDLTILLVGNNTITKADDGGIDMSHGIYFASNNHSLIIDGEGSLTINFADDRSGCFKSNGIFLEPGTFVMNGGTVVSNGGIGSEESLGIYSDQSIVFNGGSFTGNGYTTYDWHSFGIYCSSITVNGGTVYASSPLDNGEDDSCAFDISTFIINGGTVTAYGKVAFSSTWGVQCGANSVWTILAGEDEASATAVDGIPDVHYVHIVAEMASAHVHDYSVDWSKDASTHWHACTGEGDCTAPKKDEAAHVYGDDVNDPAYYTCSVCGYENATRKADYEAAQQGGEPVTKYDLYIAGVQVTSQNLEGNGWSYAPETNTLTLHNFVYEGDEGADHPHYWHFNSVVTYAGSDTFHLVLEGTNSIVNTKTDYDNLMALLSTGDMTIEGSGSLTLGVSGTASNMSMGLCVDGDLTVGGGTVMANGGASEWRSMGICVLGMRYVQNGGSVYAVGGEAGEESYGLHALGVPQVSNIGDDDGSGDEGSDGITIGTGIKKFVAVGDTSAVYTEAVVEFKRDATAWTDKEHATSGEFLSAGTYENGSLADYKYIDVQGSLPSNLIIRMRSKSSVSDAYKQAVEGMLEENETVVRVCDVTLYRVTTENGVDREEAIQPFDVDADLMLSIKMTVPASLRGKEFKILHVHAANDVEFVEYVLKGEGKYAVVRVNRLSEFAFVAEKEAEAPVVTPTEPTDPGEPTDPTAPGGQPIEADPPITVEDDPTVDNWTLTPQGGAGGTAQPGQGGQGQGGQGQGGPGQGGDEQGNKPAVTVSLEDTEAQDGVSVEIEVKTEISDEVKESENSVLKTALQADDEVAIVYEVKLIRTTIENGVEIREEIQPSDIKPGTIVSINMLIPETLRGKPFKLLHIHAADDIKEVVSYTVSDDGTTLTARVDRLSEFAFVGKVAGGSEGGEDAVEPNKIPDGAIAGIVIGGSLGLLLIGLLIFFLLRRKKNDDGKKAAPKKAPKAKKPAAAIVAAPVALEKKNVGFYRITKGEDGKCTFALFYEEGDNLSKEMGVFESEKTAYKAIKLLREKAVDAQTENRVQGGDTIPAPKFVLDVDQKGVYRYSFVSEDGAVLLQSVTYLNEKRCLEDLKKTLIAVETEEVVVENGELKEDVIEAVAETPVEAAVEEVAADVAEEIPEETVDEAPEKETEEEAEGVSLKENIAVAKATVSHSAVNKQYVADYLKAKFDEGVRLNLRGNETKTGLPLADTHYAIGEEKNRCFVYVYEVEGTTMLLVKVGDEYGQALATTHPIVKRSAFPKSKSLWYSVIVDDSFAPEEIEKILDDAYLMNGGKAAADAGLSLKESLAMAKATTTTIQRSKRGVADYLVEKYGDKAEINTRVNQTKTGLPLADTHYAVKEDGKTCFVYVYETNGTVVLLLRLTEDYAKTVQEAGHKIIRSAFPKSKYAWFTVILDDTYAEDDIGSLLDAAYDQAK